jgi:hypothetical protein
MPSDPDSGTSSPDPSQIPPLAWVGSTGSGGSGSAGGPGGGSPVDGSGGVDSANGAGTSPNGEFGGDSGAGWGLDRYLGPLGLDSRALPVLHLLPTLVSTTGGVAMTMAFLFFGKRRRDGAPPAPEEVLAAAAARGTGVAANGALADGRAIPPQPLEPDAELPRWRRPSLLEARKADPLRNAVEVAPLTFETGAVGPLEGHERRLIRYTAVRLLDAPDELRSATIGSLTQGDEVQLLEKSGTYWLVLCPDGRRGWIHKMTLGDVVGESSPTAQDMWATSSTESTLDVDNDVLTAFLTSRGRA